MLLQAVEGDWLQLKVDGGRSRGEAGESMVRVVRKARVNFSKRLVRPISVPKNLLLTKHPVKQQTSAQFSRLKSNKIDVSSVVRVPFHGWRGTNPSHQTKRMTRTHRPASRSAFRCFKLTENEGSKDWFENW